MGLNYKKNMGLWTNINGQIVSKKLSVKKIIEWVLEGEDWSGNFEPDNRFSVRFEQDGNKAIDSVNRIIESAKSRDKNCKIEIETNTIFKL